MTNASGNKETEITKSLKMKRDIGGRRRIIEEEGIIFNALERLDLDTKAMNKSDDKSLLPARLNEDA